MFAKQGYKVLGKCGKTIKTMEPVFFAKQSDFRQWLSKNHSKAKELLVGFYKVASGKASMTWPQSVDEALCFGWIDGVRRSIDQDSYCIRFTPRKPTSIWSAINIQKIEDLTRQGLMKAAGLASFALRKEHKSKIYAYEKEPAVLSAEYEKKFRAGKKAWGFFTAQAPSYQRLIVHWIMTAKQKTTQLTRLAKAITESKNQKRILR